jgi:hypothetical protein
MVAGCSSHGSRPAATGSAARSTPHLDVVLGEGGLTFSPVKVAAGRYVVSFEDRRSQRPAGQKLALQFAPSGPRIVLLSVPAGARMTGTVLANEIAWVAVNGARQSFGGEDRLTISTSAQFPTPAT